MGQKEVRELLNKKYPELCSSGSLTRQINRVIRTLPGGDEVLDAITTTNASRNHAECVGANERVVVLDVMINKLEDIRFAMERYIINELQENERL